MKWSASYLSLTRSQAPDRATKQADEPTRWARASRVPLYKVLMKVAVTCTPHLKRGQRGE